MRTTPPPRFRRRHAASGRSIRRIVAIIFRIPDAAYGFTAEQLSTLIAELDLLGDDGIRVAGQLRAGREYAISDDDRAIIARALDHLSHMPGGLDHGHPQNLRDTLVADWPRGGLIYTILQEDSTRTEGSAPPSEFLSYTGRYAIGDRLVDWTGVAWQVTHTLDGDPVTLVVEPAASDD